MHIASKLVLITNAEYTRRLSTAYDMGYANGMKETITKVARLTNRATKTKTAKRVKAGKK